ncbi:MAG: DUF4126 domain-containing protein [Halanaerobiales bacterium]|nr:DUF4126 domain-containing protein [Halanaerobiales bacterium]
MNFLFAIGLGSGLAGAAGFRASFPLLLASLLARYIKTIHLPPALEWLQSTPALILLLALMLLEFLVDQFPGVSFFHTSLYTAIKVLAGGILFTLAVNTNFFIGMIFGGLITGLLIFSGLVLKPWVLREQHYFRNLEYPSIENLASISLTILAFAVPWLSLFLVIGLIYTSIKIGWRIA